MSRRGKERPRRRVDEATRQKLKKEFFDQMKSYEIDGRKFSNTCCSCHQIVECEIQPWQGAGFSAHADAEGISCHFGSRFDMDILVWTNGQKVDGSICDECIERLLASGAVRMIGRELFQGEVDRWYEQISPN
jgi:hypothetical protein